MRFDHIVVHVDNDPEKLKSLQATLNEQGYFFDPTSGRRSLSFRISSINVGDEYIEIVRLTRRGIHSWVRNWVTEYDEGQRGAFCIFLEDEELRRTAAALQEAGIEARGPVQFRYPYLMGLVQLSAPYSVYYLPPFPESPLQLALIQYRSDEQRARFQAKLTPNARKNGINGIRRIEVDLPELIESLPLLQSVFPELEQEGSGWVALAGKARLFFRESEDGFTHLRLHTVTSQRKRLGKSCQIENVEVKVTGG